MRKVLSAMVLGMLLVVGTGCRSGQPLEKGGTAWVSVHRTVFGCDPQHVECYKQPEKSLDAVVPNDDCGKPVYKRPGWVTEHCGDGKCDLPK